MLMLSYVFSANICIITYILIKINTVFPRFCSLLILSTFCSLETLNKKYQKVRKTIQSTSIKHFRSKRAILIIMKKLLQANTQNAFRQCHQKFFVDKKASLKIKIIKCVKNRIPFKNHKICCKFKIGSWALRVLIPLGITPIGKDLGFDKPYPMTPDIKN